MNDNLKRLEKKIQYSFSDSKLLILALTHRSVGSKNNERLEFLGDAILGFCIADKLFHKFPDTDEGELSRLRATIVKGTSLADVAHQLDIGSYLILGQGEKKSGGHRRDSILADTVEAIFGAIYLDGGVEPATTTILNLFSEKLKLLSLDDAQKDPKTRLQELLQGRKLNVPEYQVMEINGAAHNQSFEVDCVITLKDESHLNSTAKAGSRRKAEQQAAQEMLKKLLERGIK